MSAHVRRKKVSRKMVISRLKVIRSGLLLENGEVWDGVERRCDRLLTGACVGEPEEKVEAIPSPFFG